MGSIENLGVKKANNITFYVNGKVQKIKDDYPLTTTLNYYLREVLNLTGTKVYCHEGGCGSCAVNASVTDPLTNDKKSFSINSCLFPLYSCDGYSFTTVEGLGNRKLGLNPIQKRLADNNASQCGYCTPGFVMTMYSFLKNNPKPSKEQIEKSLDGNICRCTGYRAILDTMKSFAADESPIHDIEDLTNMKCLSNGQHCEHHHNNETHRSCDIIATDSRYWHSPSSLSELTVTVRQIEEMTAKSYKLVSGNTSVGIYKGGENNSNYDHLINLKNVQELHKVVKINDVLKIGAAVSISDLISTFESVSKEDNMNFGHLSKSAAYLKRVASGHIRNVASWSGNIALKRKNPKFPSDVLVILEAIGARLNIYSFDKSSTHTTMDLAEYLRSDTLKNHLIESMDLRGFDQSKFRIKVFKTSHRSQNSHSYVNCGLRFELDSHLNVVSQPVMIFNGITGHFNRATNTEQFLLNKCLGDENVFKQAVQVLVNELKSSGMNEIDDPLTPLPKYRLTLAVSYFYKFALSVVSSSSGVVSNQLKSTMDSIVDTREVSRAETRFQSKEDKFPLTKPTAKLNAYSQTSGETKYAGDVQAQSNQLSGVFVKTTVARATIESIDIEEAMKMPGVVRIILAKDIPGENNVMNGLFSAAPEVLFADKEVEYNGQPIGLVVATSEAEARTAAKRVRVMYSNVKKPILTIEDALAEKSISFHPFVKDFIKGDAATAIATSKHQITGEFRLGSTQFNFYLEGLVAVCEPTDDGYKIECCTQWIDALQNSVANVLGIKNSSCIDVQVKQIGGGFGGKATRCNFPAAAAALATHYLHVPIKVAMSLNDCMDIMGRRSPWHVKYRAGFDDNGKLNGVDYEWYSDVGASPSGFLLPFVLENFDSAYKCENYSIKTILLKTNKPACVEVRSPELFPSVCVTENLLQHIAEYLGCDALEVRQANFFKRGDLTAVGHKLTYLDIERIVNELKESSDYVRRKKDVDEFNKKNRYKKKGISFIPLRYGLTHSFAYYNALVSVRHFDGSVSISHGGIEMGQGVHTKAAQVCAHELGIPLDIISVKSTNNMINPNVMVSGGSITSELVAKSVIGACDILKQTLEPVRKLMPENYTWSELIAKAFSMNLNLSTMYLATPPSSDVMLYDIDAASCSEVLIDVLTGETQVTRTDILYDCGQTINGLIDLGQAEGAFMMGLGFMLLEKTVYDPKTGKCLNNGTWEYKPPMASDLPIDLRIRLAEDRTNPVGVLGSKGVGEPPIVLSNSLVMAVRHAIAAAREDRGVRGHFEFDLPATVDNVQNACLIDPNEFAFQF